MDQPPPGNHADLGDATTRSHVPADAGAPTEALVSGTVGDRCVNCGAPLSSDQRYCVACGERRGAPRFTLPAATAAAAAEPVPAPVVSRPPRAGSRLGVGAVIAGVATLLLAMLVGVLIGHNTAGSATRTVASAPVRIIKVGGGPTSSGNSGSTSGSAAPAKRTSHKSTSRNKAKQAAAPPVSKKTAAAQQSAAAKVLGGKSAPPATVTVGQTGSGKGFNKKTHKFDGSFFGQ